MSDGEAENIILSHEEKVIRIREEGQAKRETALRDLEEALLREREDKYKQAISDSDIPVSASMVLFKNLHLILCIS